MLVFKHSVPGSLTSFPFLTLSTVGEISTFRQSSHMLPCFQTNTWNSHELSHAHIVHMAHERKQVLWEVPIVSVTVLAICLKILRPFPCPVGNALSSCITVFAERERERESQMAVLCLRPTKSIREKEHVPFFSRKIELAKRTGGPWFFPANMNRTDYQT